MVVTKSTLLAAAALACLAAAPTAAHAAAPGFCADYARAAVRQFEAARAIPGCLGGASARWNPDYRIHYGWCLNVAPPAAFTERDIRTRELSGCRRRAGY